jgi:hypothetical protein
MSRVKNISKKSAPAKAKDPKKVAAGRARAEQALKDSKGRYVSSTLAGEIQRIYLARQKVNVSKVKPDNKKEITRLMKENNITAKDVAEFYSEKPDIINQMIETGTTRGTALNSGNTKKGIDQYKGKLFIDRGNGDIKQVTKAQLLLHIDRFKQFITSNMNAADFSVNPILSFDGRATYQIPRAADFSKYLKEYFDIKNLEELEDFTADEINEAVTEFIKGLYKTKEQNLNLYLS